MILGKRQKYSWPENLLKNINQNFMWIRQIVNNLPILRRLLNLIFTSYRSIFLYNSLKFYNVKNLPKTFQRKDEKILVAGTVSVNSDVIIENILASSCSESSKIYSLKCDGLLSACFNCKKYLWDSNFLENQLSKKGPLLSCKVCIKRSETLSSIFNTEPINFSDNITDDEKKEIEYFLKSIKDIEDIKSFRIGKINIGKHAYAGAVRFYASPFLEREFRGMEIARSYLKSAIQSYYITKRILKNYEISTVIVNHGIYVPQGVIAEVASNMGIKTLCFATGYRNKTYMVSKNQSYHFDMIKRLDFENNLDNYSESEITDYLKSRASGKNDWILFHEQNDGSNNFDGIIQNSKNNIVLFTNVLWDGDVHFDEHFFKSMLDWIETTTKYLLNNEKNNIIIRIHPGEQKGFVKSRVFLEKELANMFSNKELSKLKIITPTQNISSYALADLSDHIIIYGSKLGIELAALGHVVLCGGPSWTINKGITIDPKNIEEYLEFLNQMNKNVFKKNQVDLEKAKKFAYYVFFQRCLKLNMVKKRIGDPPFEFQKVDKILLKQDLDQFHKFLNK